MENTLTLEDLGKRKSWKRKAIYGPLADLGEDEEMEDLGENERMSNSGDNGTTLTMEDLGKRKSLLLPAALITGGAVLLAKRARRKRLAKARAKKLTKASIAPSETVIAVKTEPAPEVAGYRIRTFPYGKGMEGFGHRMGIGRKIRTFEYNGMGSFGAEAPTTTPPTGTAEKPKFGLKKLIIPAIAVLGIWFFFLRK